MSNQIFAQSIRLAKSVQGPADIAVLITDVGGNQHAIGLSNRLAANLARDIAVHVDVADDGVD
jgi:hypothetical protein